MRPFWNELIGPILNELRPDPLVEVGAEQGWTTELLLRAAAQYGATVHAVDPSPMFPVEEWRTRHGERFQFHQGTSLEMLPLVPFPGALFLDGDHNHHTVLEELRLLEARLWSEKQAQPLVFLHDVAWPYARRDLYYDPDTIPAAGRRPHRVGGLLPEVRELVPRGFNAGMDHAETEGGAANGVLTAVEDYLAESKLPWRFLRVAAFHGLGILFPQPLLEQRAQLRLFVDVWSSPNVSGFIERLEKARIEALVAPFRGSPS